ncbi:MAG: hypothetical protein IKF36_05905 [Bacilli bacterium]|nr:hypothetical protein [Bacilli bacterium]
MRVNISKKDLETLFDEGRFDDIRKLVNYCYSLSASSTIVEFLKDNNGRRSTEELKEHVIKSTMKAIRSHNALFDQENFVPFYEKRSFFKKKLEAPLTYEESRYLKLFPSEEKSIKKETKGKINKESYDALKRIYEFDKDNYYTYIHRTAGEVDPIEENGIRFGSSTSIDDMCQRMDNFYFMLREISNCNNYKFSSGCFIIKIPKTAITENSEPIFYNKDEDIYLNPKYVVAYATVRGTNIVSVELNEDFNIVQSKYYNEENVITNVRSNPYK